MPHFEALAQNLKNKRKELNQTQLTFAVNCGLSEDEICKIENQNTDPKLSTIQCIAAYTGLTIQELLQPQEDNNIV